jgi:hypothetical protein
MLNAIHCTMATPFSQDIPADSGTIDSTSSLSAELLEKQLQALERFQTLRAIYAQYTGVFQDIMEATNGETNNSRRWTSEAKATPYSPVLSIPDD